MVRQRGTLHLRKGHTENAFRRRIGGNNGTIRRLINNTLGHGHKQITVGLPHLPTSRISFNGHFTLHFFHDNNGGNGGKGAVVNEPDTFVSPSSKGCKIVLSKGIRF